MAVLVVLVTLVSDARASTPADVYGDFTRTLDAGHVTVRYRLKERRTAWKGVMLHPRAGSLIAADVSLARADGGDHAQLERARLQFTPALPVTIAGQTVEVTALSATSGGEITELTTTAGPPPPATATKLKAALRLEPEIPRLLAGLLFRGDSQAACKGAACRPSALVESLQWFDRNDRHLTVRANTRWTLGDDDRESCFHFTGSSPSDVRVPEASFNPASGESLLRVQDLNVVVAAGCIGLDRDKLRLQLEAGSQFRLAELEATRTARSSRVGASFRSGTFRLGEGSTLQLAQDQQTTLALAVERGDIGFERVTLRHEDGRLKSVEFAPDTTLDLAVSRGQIGLWQNARSQLGGGHLRLSVTNATWNAGHRPLVISDANAVSMDLALTSPGRLGHTPDSTMSLIGGRLTATAASLDSRNGAHFIGPFGASTFKIGAGGRLVVPGGITLDRMHATELVHDDASHPLSVLRGPSFPTGRLKIRGIAGLLTSMTDQALACEETEYGVDIVLDHDGFSLAAPLTCAGKYTLKVHDSALTLDARLRVDRLSLKGGVVGGGGHFTISAPDGQSVDITTDRERGERKKVRSVVIDAVTLETLPATFRATLEETLQITGDFTIANGLLDFKPQPASAAVRLSFADQDVVLVDVEGKLGDCTGHIAVTGGSHSLRATLAVDITQSRLNVALTELSQPDPPVDPHERGCERYTVGLTALFVGVPGPFIAHAVIGELVERVVRRKIEEFSKTLLSRELFPMLPGLTRASSPEPS